MPENKNFLESLFSSLDISKGDGDLEVLFQIGKIAEEMPGGFFIYRAGGDEEIIYANQAMLRIFNCDTMEEFREWTGNSFRGIVHPEDIEAVEESIWQQIDNSQYDLDYVEYRIIQKGGQERWIEDYGHFIHHEKAGDFFCVFVSDATEKHLRQLAEREAQSWKEQTLQTRLQEYHEELESVSREHLRRLEVIEGLSNDYESIFYVDLNSNTVKTYRVSKRIGYQFDDREKERPFEGFAADYIKTWVKPEDQGALETALGKEHLQTTLAGRKTFSVVYRIQQGGEEEYLELHVVNVGALDLVSQVVMGVRNVDEKIREGLRQREVLESALRRASAAVTVKDTFLANMSHDMRTPMNAVMGYAALAKKHVDDKEKLLNYLDMIEAAGGQTLQLINDVLELSRVEAGQDQLQTDRCDLTQVFQRLQADALPKTQAKGLSLKVDVSGLRNTVVHSDENQLEHLMSRLISNAVNYTEKGGEVTISAVEVDGAPEGYGKYRFEVVDTGIGIGKEFMERLFEPFEREKNTTHSGLLGTGLGLTIARSIVERLGGSIEVESKQGVGSRFSVTFLFPLEKTGSKTSDRGEAGAERKLAGRRILVVEDNAINMEIEVEVLQDAGFLTDTAENGSIALEKLKQAGPGYYHLILMDIQMPVMNGYQAAEAIRKIEDRALATIPIIAISANAFEEDRRRSMESGMNAHVAKPIDIPALLELIEKNIADVVEKK